LLPKLKEEIDFLMNKHKEGIVIRLHVLGDFMTTEYVSFWEEMLFRHHKLCLFGYTARKGDNIAHAIWRMNKHFSERCVIRHSGNKAYDGKLVPTQDAFKENWSYAAEESFEGASFDCPEQTGKLKIVPHVDYVGSPLKQLDFKHTKDIKWIKNPNQTLGRSVKKWQKISFYGKKFFQSFPRLKLN
tara:strand:- start:58 stop:615 length:558 start_codon:yes stop_codon:yes gene_type:complete